MPEKQESGCSATNRDCWVWMCTNFAYMWAWKKIERLYNQLRVVKDTQVSLPSPVSLLACGAPCLLSLLWRRLLYHSIWLHLLSCKFAGTKIKHRDHPMRIKTCNMYHLHRDKFLLHEKPVLNPTLTLWHISDFISFKALSENTQPQVHTYTNLKTDCKQWFKCF